VVESLESEDFYYDASVGSSPKDLFRRITTHANFQCLTAFIATGPENAERALTYAQTLSQSIRGSVRSEKDIALCALVIALSRTGLPAVDDLLTFLRMTRVLALKLPAEMAHIAAQSSAKNMIVTFGEEAFDHTEQPSSPSMALPDVDRMPEDLRITEIAA
jgi:hypothetical protein